MKINENIIDFNWEMDVVDYNKMCKFYNIIPEKRTMLDGIETTFFLYAC